MTPRTLQGRSTGKVLLLILLAGAICAGPVVALDPAEDSRTIQASVLAASRTAGHDTESPLSTGLIAWLDRQGSAGLRLQSGPEARTFVYVLLDPGVPTSVLDDLLSGIDDRDEENGLVTARVTADELGALARFPDVRRVREVSRPILSSGRSATSGDAILRADLVRNRYGINGSGIRVGVISDGVDHLLEAQESGDVPPGVHVIANGQGGDEGTAMLEIIHDLAPGAELYFHDHGDSALEFNQAVDALVAAGCRVIVDDVAWPREPFFEDGVIARHLSSLLATRDIVYVSAAGNYARQHYQGAFRNMDEGFHDFSATGSGPRYLYADLPFGSSIQVVLQWDEPFGGSGEDFDLFLVDTASGEILDSSMDLQNGDDDPIEALRWTNFEQDLEAAIVVYDAGGRGAGRTIEVFAYPASSATLLDENTVIGDSIYGHQAVPSVVAVGAVSAMDPETIEPYSSNGPVTHISPVRTLRQKPDVCGVDRVEISGAGDFRVPFIGTSAASPHVAAVCALAWSARPGMTADEVRSALSRSAVDLGAFGWDPVFGYGRTDALAMYGLVTAGSPTPTPTPSTTPGVTPPGPVITPVPSTPTPSPTVEFGRTPFGRRYPGSGSGSGGTTGPGVTTPTPSPTGRSDGAGTIGRPFQRWYPTDRWGFTR